MTTIRAFAFASTLALLAAGAGAHAAAGDPAGDAAAFGAREAVLDISLSPDGSALAFIGPGTGSAEILYIVDIAKGGGPRAITKIDDSAQDLSWCRWSNNSRLVCSVHTIAAADGHLLGFTRLFALGRDGRDVQQISGNTNSRSLGYLQDGGSLVALDVPGQENRILVTRQYVPESTVGTMLSSSAEGTGVDEVDIINGRHRLVEAARLNADYIADAHGTVRVMGVQRATDTGYTTNSVEYSFRLPGERNWKPLSRVTVDAQRSTGFVPVAVDSERNVAYGFDGQDGRLALFSVALDGSGKRDLLLSNDKVDVDDLIRIGRQRRVIGASYATEQRVVEYFDPEMKQLAADLGKIIPGHPAIDFVGATEAEDKLLLIASSDVDPGMIYLYDRTKRALTPVLPLRPALAERAMGTMKPVTFPASDGTQIPGYLTLPAGSDGRNLPAIVLPHGGPSARDEWGFDWLVQFFAARGYAVLQPNFRGSAGYGSNWFLNNGFQSWRTAIGDVDDAGRWLVQQGIARPEQLAIVGWSYGGYAALQSQVADPALYKAVVAIAPVADLEQLRTESRGYSSYRQVDAFIGSGAHVAQGSPARNARNFQAPVLLFHGDLDQNVAIAQSATMEDRLRAAGKPVRLVRFDGLDHQLDDSDARTAMLTQIDRFLTETLHR